MIKPEDVPGPGYRWYKLGPFGVTPSSYVWFSSVQIIHNIVWRE